MAHDNLWMDAPEDHDYQAAQSFLSLLTTESEASALVEKLKVAELCHYKAKDLLRASRLGPLPRENVHVAHDLKKIKDGKKLSPVLLVRGDRAHDVPLTIADGYHRICASWHSDENALIPCRLA